MKRLNFYILSMTFFLLGIQDNSAFPHLASKDFITPYLEVELVNYETSYKNAYYTVFLTNAFPRMRSKKIRKIFSIVKTGKVKHDYDGSALVIKSQRIPDYWYYEKLKPNYVTVVFHQSPHHLLNTEPTRISLETSFEPVPVIERKIPHDAAKNEADLISDHNKRLHVEDTPQNRNYISRFTFHLVEEGEEEKVHKIITFPQI